MFMACMSKLDCCAGLYLIRLDEPVGLSIVDRGVIFMECLEASLTEHIVTEDGVASPVL